MTLLGGWSFWSFRPILSLVAAKLLVSTAFSFKAIGFNSTQELGREGWE